MSKDSETSPQTAPEAPATRRVWFDTEFIEDGRTIELLSIGLVRWDAATFYAEPEEADHSRASDWVRMNVLPHLSGPRMPRRDIVLKLLDFCGERPEFWAYYADYDWVALCQLFGTMMDLPGSWPMFCRDVQQVRAERGFKDLPEQASQNHNALADAIWTRDAHLWMEAQS